MKNMNLTILDYYEYQQFGFKSAMTDYAILSGGWCSGEPEKRDGESYWTYDKVRGEDMVLTMNPTAEFGHEQVHIGSRFPGIRPAVSFSTISSNSLHIVEKEDKLEVEYGEYPEQAVPKQLQNTLESLFKKQKLSKTGKIYTRDKKVDVEYIRDEELLDHFINMSPGFQIEQQEEYEYQGKKYVRVRNNSVYFESVILSNGISYQYNDYVWVEVSPIKWLVRKTVGTTKTTSTYAITDKIIMSGIQFWEGEWIEENFMSATKYTGIKNFKLSNLYNFLNTYLVQELEPSSIILSKEKENTTETTISSSDGSKKQKVLKK